LRHERANDLKEFIGECTNVHNALIVIKGKIEGIEKIDKLYEKIKTSENVEHTFDKD